MTDIAATPPPQRPAAKKFVGKRKFHGFSGPKFPYTIETKFIPHGAPENHPIREMHDDRALPDEAPDGFWDVLIWDENDRNMPVGRSTFVAIGSDVVCDCLAVERDHCGQGLGLLMLTMGQRLWGAVVMNAGRYTDDREWLWWSGFGMKPD